MVYSNDINEGVKLIDRTMPHRKYISLVLTAETQRYCWSRVRDWEQ